MKKIVLAIAAFTSLAGSAFAQQAYVGAAVGQSHFNVDCSGTTSCKDNDTGYKLFGGYKFTPNLAGELTYFDYGKVTAGVPLSATTSATVKIRGTGVGLGVAFMADFAPPWSGVGRLGVVSNRAKVSVVSGTFSGSDSESKTTAYAGVGVSYAINPQMKLDAALDFSNLEYAGEKSNVRLLSVGLTYAF